jgi:hypothetical protein
MKIDIRNHSQMTNIEQIAEDLYKFAHEQLEFDKPARIVFEAQGDRAVDIFSPTGNYNPSTQTITIYVDHRHPKDILRSVAHELIHHAQCCQGEFNNPIDTSAGYAQKDQHMREMEKDAYFRGNITLFRDWEDYRKKNSGRSMMSENKETEVKEEKVEVKEIKKEEKIKTVQPKVEKKTPLKNWYNNSLYNSLMKKFIKT